MRRRPPPCPPAASEHVRAALRRYEEANARRVTVARTVMFAVLALWVLLNYGADSFRANVGIFALFALLGLAQYALVRGHPERQWVAYLFVALDTALLAYTVLAPGRVYPPEWPWAMALRQPNFAYFLTIIALAALSIRPLLVLWAGACVSLTWAGAAWLIGGSPDAGFARRDFDPDPASYLAEALDPRLVLPDDAVVKAFVTLLVSLLLALAVWRARRLIYEEAEAARERANLARYLAPSMVERLALSDRPMTGEARVLEVAVLFADLKGFTALAERLPAGATMELLRAFHGRMADAVFRHRGTLDKFIGDGLMATFGTPEPGPDDAARALSCARDMLASVAAWNRERALAAGGASPLEVGIGLHHGPVTAGDIGGADRFEYAVIGDTVNVANRLEHLTREVGFALVASDALRLRAAAEGAEVGDLRALGARTLRGRREGITVWGLPAPTLSTPCAGPRRAASAGATVAGLSPED